MVESGEKCREKTFRTYLNGTETTESVSDKDESEGIVITSDSTFLSFEADLLSVKKKKKKKETHRVNAIETKSCFTNVYYRTNLRQSWLLIY